MTQTILITGSTGLIGKQILQLLLTNTNFTIVALIRARDTKELSARKNSLLMDVPTCRKPDFSKRLIPIAGDQTKINLGMENRIYNNLRKSISEIYHCAALAEFRRPLKEVRLVNVEGTKNIVHFARGVKKLRKINYISTAFVAGNYSGIFKECNLNLYQEFNNTYEQSKFEAEVMLRKYSKQLSVVIYRPSIVVGEYRTGITNNFRMFYQPFRTLSLEAFDKIPVNKKTKLNIISCDAVAKAIYLISTNYHHPSTYHIVSPKSISITKLMNFASEFFCYKQPKFVALEDFKSSKYSPVYRKMLESYIPYFNFKATFGCKQTLACLKKLNYVYPEINDQFLGRLFNFCLQSGYIKKRSGGRLCLT